MVGGGWGARQFAELLDTSKQFSTEEKKWESVLGVWKTTTFHNEWVVFNNFDSIWGFFFFYESVRKGRVNEHRLFYQGGHKRTCADLHCISCPLWLTAPAEGDRWGGASRLLRGRIGSPTFYSSRYERLYSMLAFKDGNCAQILTFISRAEVNDTHFMYISVCPCFVIGTDACTLSVWQYAGKHLRDSLTVLGGTAAEAQDFFWGGFTSGCWWWWMMTLLGWRPRQSINVHK